MKTPMEESLLLRTTVLTSERLCSAASVLGSLILNHDGTKAKFCMWHHEQERRADDGMIDMDSDTVYMKQCNREL